MVEEKKSKYQGLVYDAADDMWKAEAVIQNKKVHLCSAKDEDLCAKRARRKSKELKITKQKIGVNLEKAVLGPKVTSLIFHFPPHFIQQNFFHAWKYPSYTNLLQLVNFNGIWLKW